MRVGIGYDVHQLVDNRSLILGGVTIPHSHGLLGHSDADVLVHAIMDALLGASGLGDIGQHFPDTDPDYKGISSIKLLKHVGDLLGHAGYKIGNIDSVLMCQAPKLSPYMEAMTKMISEALSLDRSQVNVKATTTEKLGFVGKKEGIASEAIALIYKA